MDYEKAHKCCCQVIPQIGRRKIGTAFKSVGAEKCRKGFLPGGNLRRNA